METFRQRYTQRCEELQIEPLPSLLETLDARKLRHDDDYPRRLDLSGTNMTVKGCIALCEPLKDDQVFIDVALADSFLGDDGCAMLAQALKTNSTVQKVDLRGNNIRSEGAIHLGQMLKVNRSLLGLYLEWNCLGVWETGIKAFAEGLSVNQTLRELDLRNNRIGPQGAVALANALKHNTCLRRLDLRWNNAGLVGGRALGEMLRWNGTLTHVDLTGNEIPEDILKGIAIALERNLDRQKSNEEDHARATFLDRELQVLSEAHRDRMVSLTSELESKTAEYERHRSSAASQIEQASLEIDRTQRSYREAEQKIEQLQKYRDFAEIKLASLEETLTRERSEQAQIVSSLQKELFGEREIRIRCEEERRVAHVEMTSRILKLEAELRDAEVKLEHASRDKHESILKSEEEKDKLRILLQTLEGKIQETEIKSKTALHTLEDGKNQEIQRLHSEYKGKLDGLEARIKTLEKLRIQSEEESEMMRAKMASHKLHVEEKILETELNLKKQEEMRRQEAEAQLALLRRQRDDAQNEAAARIAALSKSEMELEMRLKKEREARLHAEENLAMVSAEMARHVSERNTFISRSEEQQRVESDLRERLRKAQDGIREAKEAADAGISLLRSELERERKEQARLREELRIWDEEAREMRDAEIRRMQELEAAISGCIRGMASSKMRRPASRAAGEYAS